jgi:hypothetical protein
MSGPVKPLAYTNARVELYEQLKAVRHQIGLEEYRRGLRDLNKRELVARKKAEERAKKAEAKEREREKEEARLEAIRYAESEKKAKERAKRKAEKAKAKRAEEKALNQEVSAEVNLDIRVRRIHKGEAVTNDKGRTITRTVTATGTGATIKAKIKAEIDKLIVRLENDSELEVVSVKQQQTLTPIKRKPTDRRKVQMMKAMALNLDGGEIQTWDTGTDRCVFDFIIWRYGDLKGCKKLCNYEAIDEIIRKADPQAHPLSEGVDVFQCQAICDAFGMRLYALDEEDNIIHTHAPTIINKNLPPLIFRVKNGHFYAITNKSNVIASIAKAKKRVSEMTHFKTKAEEEIEQKEKDALTFEILETGEDETRIQQMVRIMKEKHLEVFNGRQTHKNIHYADGQLVSFILDGVKYAWDEDETVSNAMKIAELNDTIYAGETTHTILMGLMDSLEYSEKKSICNPHTYKSLIADGVKYRTHIGHDGSWKTEDLKALVESGQAICADIAKCYTSVMEKPMSPWIKLGFNDKWEAFDGEVKTGLYFVKTDDMTLFHSDNIYSNTIIEKATTEGIAFEIVAQLLPSEILPTEYFHPLLEQIHEKCHGDKDLKKSLTNIITGYLGKHQSHKYFTKIDTDCDTVWSDFAKEQFHENPTFLHRCDDYYVYGFKQDFENAETSLPMYIQILDQSNIRLFDMIKASGGECLYRKTDCAIIRGGSLTYGTQNGAYRRSDVPEKLAWAKTAEDRAVDASIVEIDGWEYHAEVKSSNDGEKVFQILREKKGCCLTGRAGTGKTYLALNVIKQFEETFSDARVIKISFTNKASLNFGGTTIHKFLKMDGRGRFNLSWLKCLKNKNVLIVCDEISMNPAEIWRRLAELKKALHNARWRLMGDHRQCPPVEENPINYFDASVVKYLCNNQRVELMVRQRYDEALWNFAEDVYERLLTDMSLVKTMKEQDMAILSKTTNICYFNRTRKDLNEKINQYVAKSIVDKIDSPFESEEEEYQQSAILYVGLPIIAHRNFSKTVEGERVMMCANSESFVVTRLDDELLTAVSVRPDEEGNPCDHEFVLKTAEFHKFFCLNYCSTTHKQQGATIDNDIVIFDYSAMSRELRYTALTRAKRLNQITIFRK